MTKKKKKSFFFSLEGGWCISFKASGRILRYTPYFFLKNISELTNHVENVKRPRMCFFILLFYLGVKKKVVKSVVTALKAGGEGWKPFFHASVSLRILVLWLGLKLRWSGDIKWEVSWGWLKAHAESCYIYIF